MTKQTADQSTTSKQEEISDEKLENVSGGRAIQMNTQLSGSTILIREKQPLLP